MQQRQGTVISKVPTPERASGMGRSLSISWPELVAAGLTGISIGVALILGTHYLGRNANAHVGEGSSLTSITAPVPLLEQRGNPFSFPLARTEADDDEFRLYVQVVKRDEKADLLAKPALDDALMMVAVGKADRLDIARAQKVESATRQQRKRRRPDVRLVRTPPVWKLEQSWRLARAERARILAERKRRLRERMCLAKALYFEARGEGIKGQMAVAQVILNRVRDPRFPNTVCGVVYQGAERRNACQFSFACDGKPDYPTNARQWALAKRLAAKALQGKIRIRGMEGVAFYHADYVRPQWASMMRPVIKIGRHIFYRDS